MVSVPGISTDRPGRLRTSEGSTLSSRRSFYRLLRLPACYTIGSGAGSVQWHTCCPCSAATAARSVGPHPELWTVDDRRLRVARISLRRFRTRLAYNANTCATRQTGRYNYRPADALAGDIELNPGPDATPPVAPPGAGTGTLCLPRECPESEKTAGRPPSMRSCARAIRHNRHHRDLAE